MNEYELKTESKRQNIIIVYAKERRSKVHKYEKQCNF